MKITQNTSNTNRNYSSSTGYIDDNDDHGNNDKNYNSYDDNENYLK